MASTSTASGLKEDSLVLPDLMASWVDATVTAINAWLQWRDGMWRTYQALGAEAMRRSHDPVCDWSACFGGVRGAEHLA